MLCFQLCGNSLWKLLFYFSMTALAHKARSTFHEWLPTVLNSSLGDPPLSIFVWLLYNVLDSEHQLTRRLSDKRDIQNVQKSELIGIENHWTTQRTTNTYKSICVSEHMDMLSCFHLNVCVCCSRWCFQWVRKVKRHSRGGGGPQPRLKGSVMSKELSITHSLPIRRHYTHI